MILYQLSSKDFLTLRRNLNLGPNLIILKLLKHQCKLTLSTRLKSTIRNVLQKTPALLAQSFFTPGQSSSKATSGAVNPDQAQRKRGRGDDEDPIAGLDQGNEKKTRKGKDTKPSKKSSTSKESSKGKTLPKTSKTGKSVTVKEIVYEVVDIDQPLNHENDIDNADDQPDAEVAPKTDKSTWFKQPPRPPTPDPEWNKGKAVEVVKKHVIL
ncbi:hypothetical protein Tco_0939024 [Tanacetum coccineum]|uniref:Uncharacterized protein n=1 Tax=Tanacetum coccineum TaxID=301880 RepID=A0ABQ5DQT8_9ASTR